MNSSVRRSGTGCVRRNGPGASVELTNLNTGVSQTTETTDAGRYIFPSLIPGSYSLKVSKKGFETYIVSQFVLEVAQRATVDAVLKVGATSQTVTVSAGGLVPFLAPNTNELGNVIDRRAWLTSAQRPQFSSTRFAFRGNTECRLGHGFYRATERPPG